MIPIAVKGISLLMSSNDFEYFAKIADSFLKVVQNCLHKNHICTLVWGEIHIMICVSLRNNWNACAIIQRLLHKYNLISFQHDTYLVVTRKLLQFPSGCQWICCCSCNIERASYVQSLYQKQHEAKNLG